MTHGHEEIRNARTIRLEGKSGLRSSRGLIRQGVGQCRAGGTRAGETVAVLQYSVPDRSVACASACTCACACTSTSNHEKGLVCTLDARKDQTHAAHRPTGSICGDNQTASAGSLSFDLLPCGSCGGSGLETRDSRLESVLFTLPRNQRLHHRSVAFLPGKDVQGPRGSC